MFAQGYIVLNPGDTFTHQFSTLPYIEPVGVANGDLGCGLTVFVQNTGAFDFRFEAFESSLTDVPFISNTFLDGVGGAPAFWYGAAAHWQDLQGVVRFTGISGTTVINRFQIDAYLPHDAASMDLFSVVVVPEPSTFGMTVIGVTALCAWRRLGKHAPMTSAFPTAEQLGCTEPRDPVADASLASLTRDR